MSKNGDIRGFFNKNAARAPAPSTRKSKMAVQVSPEPEPLMRRRNSPPLPPEPLDMPSSPITPQKKIVKTPIARDTEIKGSDEEDDDSDASLESLGKLLGRKSGPSYQRPVTLATTPKAKRIASGTFHRSPLTLQQQPKHKFDLKTLLSHAKQDNATDESARKAEEARSRAEKELELDIDPDQMAGGALTDEDEAKGVRLAMAIDRTAGDESHPRAYFFSPQQGPVNVSKQPFPKKAVKTKPWSILQDPMSRSQTIIHGLPTALARKGKELPDELYLWILDEVCVEKDLLLRNQYISLASLCRDDTRRLVTEERLYRMLSRIEGPEHSVVEDKFELSPGLADPYPGRDWSPLRCFLDLLGEMAPNMAMKNNIGAAKLLLRLSLDPIMATVAGLRAAYSKAMLAVVRALPAAEAQWSSCCKDICKYLYTHVDEASQRNIAISFLPLSTPRLVELQRRLAIEALLDEPNLGARDPGETVTFSDLFSRIAEPDFQITGSTDFGELNALISLLDIVVHDGSHLYRVHLFPDTPSPTNTSAPGLITPSATTISPSNTPSPEAEVEARSNYDRDVDRLVAQLKILHDKISDNTLVSKKEAKLALDGIMKRLTNTVRSQPPPKTSHFGGFLGTGGSKEDKNLPKQRNFMKTWANVKSSAEEESKA